MNRQSLIGRFAILLVAMPTPSGLALPPPDVARVPPTRQDLGGRYKLATHRLDHAYATLPTSFEANQGQSNPRVKFLSRGNGYNLFLTPEELVLDLSTSTALRQRPAAAKSVQQEEGHGRALRMRLVDANPHVQLAGEERLPGNANYFIGNDRKMWHTNIPTYRRVAYVDVYPGIDLVYHGAYRNLEYDFFVAPGANPERIAVAFDGVERLALDASGDLTLQTKGGEQVRFRRPLAYQSARDARRMIEARYVLRGRRQVSFEIGDYDFTRTLVIDPVLVYSTYLGGADIDKGFGIAVGSSGNAFVTGWTRSPDFPTANALQPALGGSDDAFVMKLNPEGSALVYSTYLGGSRLEDGIAIAVDALGNAYVTGRTDSPDFPTVNPFQLELAGPRDAFVAMLDAEGSSLVYSTYLGGTGTENPSAISVDKDGQAYVTGDTGSADFPTVKPFQSRLAGPRDAFVTKFDPAGAVVYSTFLGGGDWENGRGIAVDASGNAYVTGDTNSADFPTVNPFQSALAGLTDAFVTKLRPDGSALVYSSYLGGSSADFGVAIAVDKDGQAYVTGGTASPDFPTANPLQPGLAGGLDTFVTKVTSDGTGLVYSTYLGGSNLDLSHGIAVDLEGNAYIIGETESPNFPTANPFQPSLAGSADAFITNVAPDGSALIYSTYLGGTARDIGLGIAVDLRGNAYVTGETVSPNFPTVNAIQPALAGSVDGFVAKVCSASCEKPHP